MEIQSRDFKFLFGWHLWSVVLQKVYTNSCLQGGVVSDHGKFKNGPVGEM